MSIKLFCLQSHPENETRGSSSQIKGTEAVASMNIDGMTLASSAEQRAGGAENSVARGLSSH